MLKKFLIGTFVALALMVTSTAFAAYDFGPTTLKVGSKGDYVKTLQQFVGASPVDGSFGPMTAAKVKAWQANNGLTADGMFGNMSKAKANDQGSNFPAGCTNASGFSSVTGLPCTTVVANSFAPAGCTSASGFSPVTGGACYAVSSNTLPAGCTSTAGYSSTTGMSCSGTVVISGGLQGSVDLWSEGSPNKNSVREGEANVEIYNVEAKLANQGDVKLERVDVYFGMDNTVTANSKPWTYFKDVSLTVDGVVVATMPADSSANWSEYDTGTLTTSNQEYRMRFSGFAAVMKSNTTAEIGVRVSAVGTIDTGDQDAEWQVGVETDSFKVVDGTGFATSEGVNAEDEFTIGSIKEAVIDVRDASTNPDASVIEIDATEDTDGVTIYQFEIEESNNVAIQKIEEITMTFTTATQTDESLVIRKAYLYDGSTLLGSESVAAGGAVTFDNLNFGVSADGKKTITVKVDLNDVAGGLTEGSTITVGAPNLTKFVDVNGNDEGDITETVSGGGSETHELRSSGVMITLVNTTAAPTTAVKTFTADAATEDDQGTYSISFAVKAFGADAYIDNSSEVGGANAAGQGVEFMVRSTAGTPVLSSDLLTSTTNDAQDTANVFQVEKDQTRIFTLTVIYAADSTPTDGSHEVYLESINWGTATDDTNANYYTFDLLDYKSGYLFLNGIA
jgi:peptidoglycan hydrolase-like protein with peptidoglycan-binding domain